MAEIEINSHKMMCPYLLSSRIAPYFPKNYQFNEIMFLIFYLAD